MRGVEAGKVSIFQVVPLFTSEESIAYLKLFFQHSKENVCVLMAKDVSGR